MGVVKMPKIYKWFPVKYGEYTLINGVVTGHNRIMDGTFIHTSPVEGIRLDENDVIIQTANSLYTCTIDEMNHNQTRGYMEDPDFNIKGMDKFSEFMAGYVPNEKPYIPEMEDMSILMRFGNNRSYYFDGLWIKYNGEVDQLTEIYPHIGMFQDSILCMMNKQDKYRIDIRYFPYQFGNIEFYSFETEELPVYIENSGDIEFKAELSGSVYIIQPGERKLVSKENASSNGKLTSYSDMYPAVEIEVKEVESDEDS